MITNTINIEPSIDIIETLPDMFKADLVTFLNEMIQNSRRASATAVKIQLEHIQLLDKPYCRITVSDDGGASNLETMFGSPGDKNRWHVNTVENENPAGMGMFAVLSVAVPNTPITVAVPGQETAFTRESLLRDKVVQWNPAGLDEWDKGTMISVVVAEHLVEGMLDKNTGKFKSFHDLTFGISFAERLSHLLHFAPLDLTFILKHSDESKADRFEIKKVDIREKLNSIVVESTDEFDVHVYQRDLNESRLHSYTYHETTLNFFGIEPHLERHNDISLGCRSLTVFKSEAEMLSLFNKGAEIDLRLFIDIKKGRAAKLKLPDRVTVLNSKELTENIAPVAERAVRKAIQHIISELNSDEPRVLLLGELPETEAERYFDISRGIDGPALKQLVDDGLCPPFYNRKDEQAYHLMYEDEVYLDDDFELYEGCRYTPWEDATNARIKDKLKEVLNLKSTELVIDQIYIIRNFFCAPQTLKDRMINATGGSVTVKLPDDFEEPGGLVGDIYGIESITHNIELSGKLLPEEIDVQVSIPWVVIDARQGDRIVRNSREGNLTTTLRSLEWYHHGNILFACTKDFAAKVATYPIAELHQFEAELSELKCALEENDCEMAASDDEDASNFNEFLNSVLIGLNPNDKVEIVKGIISSAVYSNSVLSENVAMVSITLKDGTTTEINYA
jgi:hypothetical protein